MIKYSRIAPRDYLILIGIGDASFKSEEKAVCGVFFVLGKQRDDKSITNLLEEQDDKYCLP